MQKLVDNRMRYIIRARQRGEKATDIAMQLSLSKRRVEQVYAYYRRHGSIPALSKAGRRSVPISDDEARIILDAFNRYSVGALYLKAKIERV